MRYRTANVEKETDPGLMDEVAGHFDVIEEPTLEDYPEGVTAVSRKGYPNQCERVKLKVDPSGKTFTAWVNPDGPEWPLDYADLHAGDLIQGVLTHQPNGWHLRQVGITPDQLDDWMRTTYRLARAVNHLLLEADSE